MPIPFAELEGSPTIQIGEQGTRATRLFKVAWADWQSFAQSLTGGWQRVGDGFQMIEPLPFPGLPTLVISSLEIRPFDGGNPDGAPLVSLTSQTNTYSPGGALVAAHYSTRPVRDNDAAGQKAPKIIPGTILTYSAELSAEYMTVPGRAWEWADDHARLEADVTPGILMPTGAFTLHWDRVARPPWNAIRAARGKVNGAEFQGAEAGKLLFLGARASRMFEFLADASLWSLEYSFAERSQRWNACFRPSAGEWIDIEDETGAGPYAEYDFAQLFTFGSG